MRYMKQMNNVQLIAASDVRLVRDSVACERMICF